MKKITRNPRFLICIIGSILLNIATWLLLYFYVQQPDPNTGFGVVLHYNVYFGIDSIGDWSRIFYIPISGSIILFVNTIASIYLSKRKVFLAAVSEYSALAIQVILCVAAFLTIISNLS